MSGAVIYWSPIRLSSEKIGIFAGLTFLFMSPFQELSAIEERELIPGFHARMIHTDRLTMAHFRVVAGAELPEHQHPQEQITTVLAGKFSMTVAGETRVCTPGMAVVIPPDTPHSGRALEDCRLVDVFHPVREDYR